MTSNPYEPPRAASPRTTGQQCHVNVAADSKQPQWQLLGSVVWVSQLPKIRCAVEAIASPDPRVIETLAKCVETGAAVYCMIEHSGQTTYHYFMVDISRDEAGEHHLVLSLA